MSADEEVTFLRQRIHDITKEYRNAVKPYVDRLIQIEAMRPPQSMRVEIAPEDVALARKLLGIRP